MSGPWKCKVKSQEKTTKAKWLELYHTKPHTAVCCSSPSLHKKKTKKATPTQSNTVDIILRFSTIQQPDTDMYTSITDVVAPAMYLLESMFIFCGPTNNNNTNSSCKHSLMSSQHRTGQHHKLSPKQGRQAQLHQNVLENCCSDSDAVTIPQ